MNRDSYGLYGQKDKKPANPLGTGARSVGGNGRYHNSILIQDGKRAYQAHTGCVCNPLRVSGLRPVFPFCEVFVESDYYQCEKVLESFQAYMSKVSLWNYASWSGFQNLL